MPKAFKAACQKAIEEGVSLLPKDLLPYFKLHNKSLPERYFEEASLIFIDNEKRNTKSWEFFAEYKKIRIATYNNIDNFFKECCSFASAPEYSAVSKIPDPLQVATT